MGHFNFIRNSTDSMNDLSPVSALRLNFDRLPIETTDPINQTTNNVFGVSMTQFVPQRVISWLDNANIGMNTTNLIHNQSKTQTDSNDAPDAVSLNFNNQCISAVIITRKVCLLHLLFDLFWFHLLFSFSFP